MARYRLILLLLVVCMVLVMQPPIQAQTPPSDAEFLQVIAHQQGISTDRLRVGDRTDLRYPLTNVLLHVAKVLDVQTGKGYLVALGKDHQPANLRSVADAEKSAEQSHYGKLDPRLHQRLQKLGATETLPVALWLNDQAYIPNRSLTLAENLALQEQALSAVKKRVADHLNKRKVPPGLAKYGPVVFAKLNADQIKELAPLSDIVKLFSAEEYREAGGSEGTTVQSYAVWGDGNTGGGTVKPVILDPGGVSDLNPYLNNSSHTILYWCAAVSTTCPNGKNIGGHATELAGVVASTHPLYRGTAPSVQTIISANTQDFSDTRVVQAIEWARANGGAPISVSWASDCGGYQTFLSRYLDWAVRNLFATFVVAAGNHPTFCPDPIGDEKVAAPGVAWSVITVGSLNDNNTGFWSGDSMSSFSDWRNPDFSPGMEKPEVVAVGENLRTTSSSGGDWLTPAGVNGSSYATAQVAGQLSLMLSRQSGQSVWPETNKAAVLASAFHDIESGQDRDGVGAVMMNISDDTYRLRRFINDSTAGSPLQLLDFPRRHENTITLEAGQRARVAIAWDSVSNGSTSDTLGADLDLCVRHPDNQTIVGCSISYENGWELVEFTAPASGQYDVLVDLAGVDPGWPGTFLGIAWSTYAQRTVCSGAIEVPATGGTYAVNTQNGPTFFGGYDGWTREQTGREQVFKLTVSEARDIYVTDSNPNLDMHLLQFASCSNDPIAPAVIASGSDSLAVAAAPAGIYYLVVDGANGAVGQTTLTVSDRPPPAAPANLAAIAGDRQVSLSWTAVSGAASYNVKRATASGGPYTSIATVSVPLHSDTTVSNGTAYFYVVSAVNSAGESAGSNEATATPRGPTGSPIKSMTFEEGKLTGANGGDSTSGTVLVESAAPLKGGYSARVPAVASSYVQEDFAGVDAVYASFYIKLYALPSSTTRIAMVSNAGTLVGNINLRTSGALQLRVGTTAIGLDSSKLTVGTVYRVGLVQKKGSGANGVLEAYLAQGDAPFGAPFASTATGTWTTQANRMRFGATASNPVDAAFDDINLDATLMP